MFPIFSDTTESRCLLLSMCDVQSAGIFLAFVELSSTFLYPRSAAVIVLVSPLIEPVTQGLTHRTKKRRALSPLPPTPLTKRTARTQRTATLPAHLKRSISLKRSNPSYIHFGQSLPTGLAYHHEDLFLRCCRCLRFGLPRCAGHRCPHGTGKKRYHGPPWH